VDRARFCFSYPFAIFLFLFHSTPISTRDSTVPSPLYRTIVIVVVVVIVVVFASHHHTIYEHPWSPYRPHLSEGRDLDRSKPHSKDPSFPR
jgi:hypothetical protein